MNTMSDLCWIAVLLLEASLAGGLVFVGWRLLRMSVNGPCRLCLCLLVAWRVSVMVSMPAGGPRWDYLWGVLFGFALLHATYHLAVVVTRLRERLRTGTDRSW